jgi:hypothetical protein
MIDEVTKGIRVKTRTTKTAVIAYADDVNIVLTAQEEVHAVQHAIESYQKASGVRINLEKSKVMALGGWETTADVMGIQYKDEVKILGITFHRKTEETIAHNWAIRMRTIKPKIGMHTVGNLDFITEYNLCMASFWQERGIWHK